MGDLATRRFLAASVALLLAASARGASASKIERLIAVSQRKAATANDEAMEAAKKQRDLLGKEKEIGEVQRRLGELQADLRRHRVAAEKLGADPAAAAEAGRNALLLEVQATDKGLDALRARIRAIAAPPGAERIVTKTPPKRVLSP